MLPPNHALRAELNDEVHARPSDALDTPSRISYLALLSEGASRDADLTHAASLIQRLGGRVPERAANHFSVQIGGRTIRWERHTEFVRYTFIAPSAATDPFATTALSELPGDWVSSIPGKVMVASHGALLRMETSEPDYEDIAERWFDGNVLVGSKVGDDAGIALTDFRVRADGFSRFVIFDAALTRRQAGRTLQRLLEIDTYRMMALLALPVARELAPFLTRCEQELSQVATTLEHVSDDDEASLLDRLTRLEAQIEGREADNHYRFSAATAYYELVQRRIEDLREIRIHGLQTFGEFTERRLAPAMNTCRAVAARQESLSQRVARANQLLSTRVDITRERQNQALLESMNRRAKAQLKLQQTVEGLSVAAVTYYIVGLVGYIAKGAKAAGAHLDTEIIMAISIPVVIALSAIGIRRIRNAITRKAA
jgi:uncharacterized membrane-anchored protein